MCWDKSSNSKRRFLFYRKIQKLPFDISYEFTARFIELAKFYVLFFLHSVASENGDSFKSMRQNRICLRVIESNLFVETPTEHAELNFTKENPESKQFTGCEASINVFKRE